MTLKSLLLIFSFISASYRLYSAPTQKNEAQQAQILKLLIKTYNQSDDPAKSFALASMIEVFNRLNKEELERVRLSSEELDAVKKSSQQWLDISKLDRDLRSKLQAEDIDKITQSNPESIYRMTLSFRGDGPSEVIGRGIECDKEYPALVKKIGIVELYSKGLYVGAYLQAIEQSHMATYIRELSNLVKTDPRFEKYKPLISTTLNPSALNVISRFSTQIIHAKFAAAIHPLLESFDKLLKTDVDSINIEGPPDDLIARREAGLIKEGLTKDNVKKYALKMAKLAPACLAVFNFKFLTRLKRDFSVARVNAFADHLKGQRISDNDIPYGLEKFKNPDNPLLADSHDAWGSLIEIEKNGANRISLVSKGKLFPDLPSNDIRSVPIEVK